MKRLKVMSVCCSIYFHLKTIYESVHELSRKDCLLEDHSFSTFAKFSEKLTFLGP